MKAERRMLQADAAHVCFRPTMRERKISTRCAYGTHCGASSSSAASAAGPYRLLATDARFLSSSATPAAAVQTVEAANVLMRAHRLDGRATYAASSHWLPAQIDCRA